MIVNARDLNLDAWSSGWGDPTALQRMAGEIAAFNTRLAAEGGHCTHRDLLDIQNALNTLALAIARVEREVAERITALSTGGRNGN